jgi:endonuclease/exonuclease/phosphatase family metal-dependent hydrolase
VLVLAAVLAGCPESDGDSDGEATADVDVPDVEDARPADDGSPDADVEDAAEADAEADAGPGPELRLMTYNIRAGLESDLGRLADAILAERPDFVALQEVDNEADRSGNVNQSYRLGQLTGLASLFRSALDFSSGGSYGLALLSRYPILTSDKLELTSSGEQRILVVVTVELEPGFPLTMAVTHLDLDAATRATQAGEIVARLASEPRVVLFGDLNEEAGGAALTTLTDAYRDGWAAAGRGDGDTFPSDAPDRRIDFVLLDGSWAAPTDSWVPVTTASDHRPVVVTVPRPD